ncbi:unnamed protein product [Owenia fusiformis]|uniref:Kinesin-like protein 6 n=1 Tax=Owenia fusiformis TaxID=6347 RepID=A0A8S4NSD7_OWEFU|nr:unnamed protein product [Owenia fusiformis]
MANNVLVAVRVRPFSKREIDKRAQLIINMQGKMTLLFNPKDPKADPRKFTFDHSYWSHDEYKETSSGYLEPTGSKYTDQLKLYKDLGQGMLTNAWEGYNCSIFAYGQTGSGKSYSIMGYGANKGLVPQVGENLFKEISAKQNKDIEYQVTFSMLEIYNEKVKDLLSKKKAPSTGLQIRQSPQKGFYVVDLSEVPVGSFEDVKARMGEGNRNRTIGQTKMNETSSRAHTIVCLNFKQNRIREKVTKFCSINLVDLAGSENQRQTQAEGQRFTEAKYINLSLSTLGRVIEDLVKKKKYIPFSDSVLTRLLKNALGGNSKTTMIAAISPDAENYDQTLSTLRYADRAKSIKTSAKVNESETSKLIQELIHEKERLLKELSMMKSGNKESGGYTEEDIQKIKQEKEEELKTYKSDLEKSWAEKLEQARKDMEVQIKEQKKEEEDVKKYPHFWNLNEDPALCGKIIHFTKSKKETVGNGKGGSNPTICLNGPSIVKDHALIYNRDGDVFLMPDKGQVLRNGSELNTSSEIQLIHQDRIRFGANNFFVFHSPKEEINLKKQGKVLPPITFEFAQSEMAQHSGLDLYGDDILMEDVMSIHHIVQGANAMAQDLERPVKYELVLVSGAARGDDTLRTELYVRVTDLETSNEYTWDRAKFLNKQCGMQELYEEFENSEDSLPPPFDKEQDSFFDPPSADVAVGVVSVPLNYLAHMVDLRDDPLTITDYAARQIGFLKVEIIPCDSKGREMTDLSLCVQESRDIIGQTMAFKIKIIQGINLPKNLERSWCCYRFYDYADMVETDHVEASSATHKYNHEKLYKLGKDQVTHQLVKYLEESTLTIEVRGIQRSKQTSKKNPKTRLSLDSSRGTLNSSNLSLASNERSELESKIDFFREKADALERKLLKIERIVDEADPSEEMIEIRRILKAPTVTKAKRES